MLHVVQASAEGHVVIHREYLRIVVSIGCPQPPMRSFSEAVAE